MRSEPSDIAKMNVKSEQRANIKFCLKLGETASETLAMLRQVYSDETISRIQCYEWYSRFKNGRTSLEDDEKPGHPCTSTTAENVAEIQRIIRENRRLTIREVCDMSGMSFETVQSILPGNLNVHRIAAKFIPRLLTVDQNEHRVNICQDLCQQAKDDPTFISRIITVDETSVYGYDP